MVAESSMFTSHKYSLSSASSICSSIFLYWSTTSCSCEGAPADGLEGALAAKDALASSELWRAAAVSEAASDDVAPAAAAAAVNSATTSWLASEPWLRSCAASSGCRRPMLRASTASRAG